MIRYVKHNEILKSRWDASIGASFNKLNYAYSWYLDIVSPGWDALISGDYEEVMPLTHRKKFGISYIVQPILCQQLGVFSSIKNESFCIDDFINAIPKKFKIIDLAINAANFISDKILTKEIIIKTNQELPLSDKYETIRSRYSKSHIKNIKKFAKGNFSIDTTNYKLNDFYRDKLKTIVRQQVELSKSEQKYYFNFLRYFDEKQLLDIYVGFDEEQNVLGSAAYLYLEHEVLIQTFSTEKGKKSGLIFYLIDLFINKNAGKDYKINFRGSSIPGVRYRNMGFGSVEKSYSLIRINRIGYIFRRMKKNSNALS